ncbi:MAG TPA: TAXI family TRAP transporter solute-binding subunit [Alphaproteobacteria bacterium]|nr:TAXI family TRAP transporter solute-binding subunit [Alphaproteobacteria bacterium]
MRKIGMRLAMAAILAVVSIASIDRAGAKTLEGQGWRVNSGVVGVVSGGVDGTYLRIAADLAAVLDDDDILRVVPIIGKGSLQNMSDIMYLKGVDIGIVQADVMAYIKREHSLPGADTSIQYITKLYNEELHILARPEIAKIEDLAKHKVNIDVRGGGTGITMTLVFERLGIAIDPVTDDQALALDKLRRGEISALAYVTGKPAPFFRNIKKEEGLHFLSVPPSPALLETYLPSQLTADDYPALVSSGAPVSTVAVGSVMAVFNWPKNSDRYKKVARFVDAFFDKFDTFLQPPRHPKWKEVNLAAELPGWVRFAPATDWLKRNATVAAKANPEEMKAIFYRFIDERQRASGGPAMSSQQKEELFNQFEKWQATH